MFYCLPVSICICIYELPTGNRNGVQNWVIPKSMETTSQPSDFGAWAQPDLYKKKGLALGSVQVLSSVWYGVGWRTTSLRFLKRSEVLNLDWRTSHLSNVSQPEAYPKQQCFGPACEAGYPLISDKKTEKDWEGQLM